MVAQTKFRGRILPHCPICFLVYEDERLAKACEDHCKANDSCSLAIGRQAVGNLMDEQVGT